MCHTAELDCGPDYGAPGVGRRFVADVLADCFGAGGADDPTRGDIALVATELLTNAARAARSQVRLSVHVHRTWVELAVTDDGDGTPQRRAAGALDTSGRGLSIVDALAVEWGVQMGDGRRADAGVKTVWVRLPAPAPAAQSLLCTV